MIKKIIFLLVCVVLAGCDRFAGPVLRNELPTEVKLFVLYSDGTRASDTLPHCDTILVGISEVGNFGMRPKKNVSIDEITIESEKEVIFRFDKEAIGDLLRLEKQRPDAVYWVLDSSGITFSSSDKCP